MALSNENRIIAKIVTERDLTAIRDRGVTPAWFYGPEHKDALDFILKHHEKYGEVPTKVAFQSHFGVKYQIVSIPESMDYLLDTCAEHAQWMHAKEAALNVSDDLKDGRTADAIASMESGLERVRSFASHASSDFLPKDLGAALRKTPVTPTLMMRTDGIHGLYRGKRHTVGGEYESAKTWLLVFVMTQVLTEGGRVAMIDFEDGDETFAHRLLSLGVDRAVIGDRDRIRYVNPPRAFASDTSVMSIIEDVVAGVDLIGVDGTSDGMTLHGWNPFAGNDDSAVQWGQLLDRIRDFEPNAALVSVDHVSKSTDRGRSLIGSQHKGAGLDGPLFTIERVIDPFGVGKCGRAEIWIGKDRPGRVRPNCGPMNGNRQQKFGDFVLDSTGTVIEARIEPWDTTTRIPTSTPEMERQMAVYEFISEYFAKAGPASTNKIRSGVKGKSTAIDAAITYLFMRGCIRQVDMPTSGNYYAPMDPPKDPRYADEATE